MVGVVEREAAAEKAELDEEPVGLAGLARGSAP